MGDEVAVNLSAAIGNTGNPLAGILLQNGQWPALIQLKRYLLKERDRHFNGRNLGFVNFRHLFILIGILYQEVVVT